MDDNEERPPKAGDVLFQINIVVNILFSFFHKKDISLVIIRIEIK